MNDGPEDDSVELVGAIVDASIGTEFPPESLIIAPKTQKPTIEKIKILRDLCGLSIKEIKESLTDELVVFDRRFGENDHEEVETHYYRLIRLCRKAEIPLLLFWGKGDYRDRSIKNNQDKLTPTNSEEIHERFQQWHEIGDMLDEYDRRRSGED